MHVTKKDYLFEVCLVAIASWSFYYFLILIWGLIVVHNPLTEPLLDIARAGRPGLYRFVVFAQDFLINAVLSLPLVYFIFKLRPKGSWRYLLLAVIVITITENMHTVSFISALIKDVTRLNHFLVWLQLSAPMALSFWLFRRMSNARN